MEAVLEARSTASVVESRLVLAHRHDFRRPSRVSSRIVPPRRARDKSAAPHLRCCWQQPFHECSLNTSAALPSRQHIAAYLAPSRSLTGSRPQRRHHGRYGFPCSRQATTGQRTAWLTIAVCRLRGHCEYVHNIDRLERPMPLTPSRAIRAVLLPDLRPEPPATRITLCTPDSPANWRETMKEI